mmetsp:Transcript_31252/g.67654  ORF Transcript_31252/g.67654 Transcript_31252/m.67654 type:complete len:106 (-) Transcript_31252:1505-1822(-)
MHVCKTLFFKRKLRSYHIAICYSDLQPPWDRCLILCLGHSTCDKKSTRSSMVSIEASFWRVKPLAAGSEARSVPNKAVAPNESRPKSDILEEYVTSTPERDFMMR